MEFTGKEDVEAPIEAVFAILSEFEAYERSAIRRGIEVRRVDETAPIGPGMAWDTVFQIRGKEREMHLVLKRYEAPTLMRFEGHGKGLEGTAVIELLSLSAKRTRMSFHLELGAKTLAARLFLQSLRLARTRLEHKARQKLAEFAKNLEERHARSA